MLKSLTFIHIGDVHFPEARNERLEDLKDVGFPKSLSAVIGLRPLASVARTLASLIEKKPDAILFTGDLTSYGDPDGYRACLSYFDDLLNLKRWNPDLVHAVPGNHDVDRKKVDPAGIELLPKFAVFREAWNSIGPSILAVDRLRTSSLKAGKRETSGAVLISINSSLGCGEMRYPEAIRSGLKSLLDSYAASVPEDEAFALFGETLDTPAFDQSHIEEACQMIGGLDRNQIPLVISHHNILAQAVPRVALYSELINAGIIRSRLSHLQRPVLYCHGHIHDHPVEVISEPEFDGSKVVSISAPQFVEGFNLISLEYSASGTPLGCVVKSYRLARRDGQVRLTTFRIPFHPPIYANVRLYCIPLLQQILANLPEVDVRLQELSDKLKLKVHQKRLLENALLEGEWIGVVEIGDKQEESVHWVVRKVIR